MEVDTTSAFHAATCCKVHHQGGKSFVSKLKCN